MEATLEGQSSVYFVHDGYVGWSYGCPANPQLITPEGALALMAAAHLSLEEIAVVLPAAQFAATDDPLYHLTGGNRFLVYGDIRACADCDPTRITQPLNFAIP